MYPSPISGPQMDLRQDEFPTTYRGEQDEFPTTYRVHPPIPQYPIVSFLPARPWNAKKQHVGFRKTTIWLSILAATLLVLGIVGTSVAGSIAMHRKSSPGAFCQSGSSALADFASTVTCSAPSPTVSVTTTVLQSITVLQSTTVLQPTPIFSSPTSVASCDRTTPVSNSQNLQTPYKTKISGVLFDINYDTQNLHGDFMSFESSTLEICIEACANFNVWIVNSGYDSSLRCSIINFDNFLSLGGNCWLKDSSHPEPAHSNQSVISASLRG